MNLTALLRVLALVAFAARGIAGDADDARWEAVVRYWEWSKLLAADGLDFPLGSYRPGRAFGATVFRASQSIDPVYWGFCSRGLGICQAYMAFPDGVVHQARGMRMRPAESESQAVQRFRARRFNSDEETANLLEAATGQMKPRGDAPAVVDSVLQTADDDEPLEVEARQLLLPVLALPSPVQKRSTPLEVLKAIQIGTVIEPARNGCMTVMPFSDFSYPQIPLWVECRDSRGVQILTRGFDFATKRPFWYPTSGGWLPAARVVQRYRRVFERHGARVSLHP